MTLEWAERPRTTTRRYDEAVPTGTLAGVGAETGEFLNVGDVVEVWIETIGTLITRIGPSVA